MRVAILPSDNVTAEKMWRLSCKEKQINYDVIQLDMSDWLSRLQHGGGYDFLLVCPSGDVTSYKQLYDEKLEFIDRELRIRLYPSMEEIRLHENKRYLADWLTYYGVPHPLTKVFYQCTDAMEYVNSVAKFPLVAKASIGASGSGVSILKTKRLALGYLRHSFDKGIPRYAGPNLRMGGIYKRLMKAIGNGRYLASKLQHYKRISNDREKRFVILQEFVPHDFEWRLVRIGESFFGHKKMKVGEKASGSKGIIYDLPSTELLNFFSKICDKYSFSSMAMDCFEVNGTFLVNELQTVFGHVQDHICEKDGVPGRLIKKSDGWEFQQGVFNMNLSYSLRLEDAIMKGCQRV